MMPNSLLSAINEYFSASAALLAIVPEGLWVGELPEEFVPPMVAIQHLGEPPVWNTSKNYWSEGGAEFLVISNDLDKCEALAVLICNTFDQDPDEDSAKISTPSFPIKLFLRTNYVVSRAQQRTRQSQPVFEINIPYKAMINRTVGRM